MKKRKIFSLILSFCLIITSVFTVPINLDTVKAADFTSKTIIQNGFSLTIQQSTDSSQRISSDTLEKIKEVYFTQYPKMRARYNPTRPRAVTMKFDPDYDGVAYTGGDMGGAGIKFSVNYLKSNPNDADCATHELFHVVQGGYMNYNSESFEGAICEGIADYARSVYGLYNSLQGWSLGEYNSSQTILTRYASNARFLTWINQNKNSEATYMLNKTMHNGTYTSDMWVQLTGMTSDELWNAYAADPNIDKITLSTQKGETFGITSGETYKITSAESGLALSVKDNSTDDGANVQQENYTEGNESQQWVLKYIGDGMYNIINKKSGKGLDVADGSTSNGANIQQYSVENGGNNNQRWVIFERGNQYTLFPVCGNGTMVADLTSSSHDAGANIQLYTWNKSKAQSFVIEPVNNSAADDTTLNAFEKIEAEDYIESCTNINVSVDESDSRSNGANIGGLIAGAWTKYYGVVFDSDASSIEINYCNPSSDSYVNVYVDSMNSTPVGVIQTPKNSSDWNTYTSVTADLTTKITKGTHDIYLEFKNSSMTGYAQNCDYFKFGAAYTTVTYDAFSKIEAEKFDEKSSNVVIDSNSAASDGKNIGGVLKDSYVGFKKINFENAATYVNICYSGQSADATGQVEVYVDSMDGTPVGTVDVPPTGSDWNTFKTVQGKLTTAIAKGEHKIYLKFVNDGSKAYVANADWFSFSTYPSSYDGMSQIEAEAFSNNNGVVIDTDSNGAPKNIGGTHDGDWTQYDNVTFAEKAGEIELNYSCQQGSGGNVLVYADSMSNTPVATIEITSTGSDWNTYTSKTVKLDSAISTGTHTIYMKFETGSGNVVNIDWFKFNKYVEETTIPDPSKIVISDSVKVEGYQMSATLGGSRVVGSVEPTINGKNVTAWGLVYGLETANGQDMGVTDEDMYVGSDDKYVASFQSTSEGTMSVQVGSSTTATYFVRTMLFSSYSAASFNAKYKVRAYAVLSDGSYVYGNVKSYSIYDVADKLYQNRLMNSATAHSFLHEKVLKVVNADYKEVDYNWGSAVVKPGAAE